MSAARLRQTVLELLACSAAVHPLCRPAIGAQRYAPLGAQERSQIIMATHNEAHLARMLKDAKALASKSRLTASEQAELNVLVEQVKEQREYVKTERALTAEFGGTSRQRGSKDAGGSDVYAAMIRAGWNAKNSNDRSVLVHSDALLGRAKADVISAAGDANPDVTTSRVAPLGIDTRFLWSSVPRTQVPFDGVPTQIQYLRESARSYPTIGTATLAIDHATDKPSTGVTAVLAAADLNVFGTVSESQPNALLGQPALRQIIQRELVQTLHRDLEDHVISTIDADANLDTLAQGTDTVVDAVYKASNDLRDNGFVPRLVAMNTDDAEAVDLMKDADDHYMFTPGAPLFGLSRVTSAIIPAGSMYVVDPSVFELHVSPLKVDTDPFSEFKANRSTVKAEFYGVAVITQGSGIIKLTLS